MLLRMKLILNKPFYFGFTLLDLSKWKMYDFHYNSDTGGLVYEIKSKSVCEELKVERFVWMEDGRLGTKL